MQFEVLRSRILDKSQDLINNFLLFQAFPFEFFNPM